MMSGVTEKRYNDACTTMLLVPRVKNAVNLYKKLKHTDMLITILKVVLLLGMIILPLWPQKNKTKRKSELIIDSK